MLGPQARANHFHVGLRTPAQPPTPTPTLPGESPAASFPALPDLLEGGSSGGVGTMELAQEEFHPQHREKAGPQAWTWEAPPQPLESIPGRHPDFLQQTRLISPSQWNRKPLPTARSLRPSGHTTQPDGRTHLTEGLSIHPASMAGGSEEGEGALGRARTCQGPLGVPIPIMALDVGPGPLPDLQASPCRPCSRGGSEAGVKGSWPQARVRRVRLRLRPPLSPCLVPPSSP